MSVSRCHPFKTVCLPLSYSGNPGVNILSHRGNAWGRDEWAPDRCQQLSAACEAAFVQACHNVPGRPCIYMGRPGTLRRISQGGA